MYSSDLRTFLNSTLGIIDDSATASSCNSLISGDFTLYCPVICLMTSWESMTNSASVPPNSRILEMPAINPRYSA